MKVHEYQAKAILRRYGVACPRGEVAFTPAEARGVAEKLRSKVVVKAQIHAGGRGKGGGVRLAATPSDVELVAKEIIGMCLKTHQTGPQGRIVRRVLVEEASNIKKELYLGIVIDRRTGAPVVMASRAGGVDIEKVAEETPELIFKEYVDITAGFQPYQARKLAFALKLPPPLLSKAIAFMQCVYRAFEETDASLVEINPLILTEDENLLALDAKINFDDNALSRHADIREMRDLEEEDPLEVEASKYSLNYIKLDGTIGCMVNGAGLAMATMDIIKLAGGMPANFLDVGGGANEEQVKNAFRILLSDKNVKAVLINIFGGIMRCDIVAQGIVKAATELGLHVPMVVRLEGTNVEQGSQILRGSGLNFTVANGMRDAAEKVVALSRG
ncbi:MAG: ADP-forming succinate--CoA ligase subunit beta [Acidobacteria bacterium]|nr:ADP-forming succinate--CoA ligase subunit beta [Acidobacteriota bacterium]